MREGVVFRRQSESPSGGYPRAVARIRWLVDEGPVPPPPWNPHPQRHPIRLTLRKALSGEADWTELLAHYDAQADDWQIWSESIPHYFGAVRRGLQFLGPVSGTTLLELCSGSNPIPASIATGAFRVALDASFPMLSRSRSSQPRVCGNADSLPFGSASVTCIVSLNGYFDARECVRVLVPDGWALVCWTFGPWTPMYRTWESVLDDFPPGWALDRGRGPWGEFGILRRRN